MEPMDLDYPEYIHLNGQKYYFLAGWEIPSRKIDSELSEEIFLNQKKYLSEGWVGQIKKWHGEYLIVYGVKINRSSLNKHSYFPSRITIANSDKSR